MRETCTAIPHDAAYCDAYRPKGHVCNQPHAQDDPFGQEERDPSSGETYAEALAVAEEQRVED